MSPCSGGSKVNESVGCPQMEFIELASSIMGVGIPQPMFHVVVLLEPIFAVAAFTLAFATSRTKTKSLV